MRLSNEGYLVWKLALSSVDKGPEAEAGAAWPTGLGMVPLFTSVVAFIHFWYAQINSVYLFGTCLTSVGYAFPAATLMGRRWNIHLPVTWIGV